MQVRSLDPTARQMLWEEVQRWLAEQCMRRAEERRRQEEALAETRAQEVGR